MKKYDSFIDQLQINIGNSACIASPGEGWASYANFISPDLVAALREELTSLYEQGEFRQAGIGKGSSFQVRPEIRSDKVLWLDAENLSEVQRAFWNEIEELRQIFNKEFFLGLKSFEAHFTKYPAGSFYKRHLDQFKSVPYRIISCILYLNPAWEPSMGGQLRIYLPDENQTERHVDIAPVAGTLAVFKSAEIPHEVLVTHQERYSLTGWMRNIDYY